MAGPMEGDDGWGKTELSDAEVEALNQKLSAAIRHASTLTDFDIQQPEQTTPLSE